MDLVYSIKLELGALKARLLVGHGLLRCFSKIKVDFDLFEIQLIQITL
jgi:hypothetical protein